MTEKEQTTNDVIQPNPSNVLYGIHTDVFPVRICILYSADAKRTKKRKERQDLRCYSLDRIESVKLLINGLPSNSSATEGEKSKILT